MFYTFYETGLESQLCRCAAKGALRQISRHVRDFKKDSAGSYDCYPMVNSSFPFTHTYFSRLLRNRFVREYADPHFTTTVEKAVDRYAGSLNLLVGDPSALKHLDPILPEVDKVSTL